MNAYRHTLPPIPMNILFLCKRKYMAHDVIVDRYARLYELPAQLAALDVDMQCMCMSYQGAEDGVYDHGTPQGQALVWYSFSLRSISSLLAYFRQVNKLIRDFKPDLILGSSDCLQVILTAYSAKRAKLPYVIDLYDNYASFGMAKIPGILPLYHWALHHAQGISCVSEPLAAYIRQSYRCSEVMTLESTIKGNDFYPMDKQTARAAFNLPQDAKLIGIAGGLNKERGIRLLYDSFLSLAGQNSQLHLALAGVVDHQEPIPNHPRVHYLGQLPHQEIVKFYNALDLAVVCMRDTDFGRFAFPQKTYEILACGIPLLAPRLGALQALLQDYPQCLYEPDNPPDFQAKMQALLVKPQTMKLDIPTWQDQAKLLHHWLQTILGR